MSSPQMAGYFAYCESPMLGRRPGRDTGVMGRRVEGGGVREAVYSLGDISARCTVLVSQLVGSRVGGSCEGEGVDMFGCTR